MNPETRFKEKVYEDLNRLPNIFYEKIQQRSIHGTLDIIFCIRGRYGVLELKREDIKAEPLQIYKMKKIREAGGLAFLTFPENWAEVYSELKTMALGAKAPPLR